MKYHILKLITAKLSRQDHLIDEAVSKEKRQQLMLERQVLVEQYENILFHILNEMRDVVE